MMKVHLVNRMTLSHLTKVLELDNYLITGLFSFISSVDNVYWPL